MMYFYRVGLKNMYVSDCGNVMMSYDKIIVIRKDGHIYINADYYNCSKTTSQHRNQYLNVTNKEFYKNAEKGYYIFLPDNVMMEMYYNMIKDELEAIK